MADNQWPTANASASLHRSTLQLKRTKRLVTEIENWFEEEYQRECLLLPSARSALALVARFHGLSRGQYVYIPPYSARCMYDVLGPYGDITTLDGEVFMDVVVHKWGHVNLHPADHGCKVLVEDSADSVHLAPTSLFPNHGDYEVVSLPKVIGTPTGAVLISRRTGSPLIATARATRASHARLARTQFRAKRRSQRDGGCASATWSHSEHLNVYLARSEGEVIRTGLPLLRDNRNITMDRLEVLHQLFGVPFSSERLGPVVVLDLAEFPVGEAEAHSSGLLHRHFDTTLSNGTSGTPYKRVLVCPLHFGISDESFRRSVDTLQASWRG